MGITLYYLNYSRAIRIVWLLEALKLPYEAKVYQRDRKTMLAPPELANVHPSGNSPVIEDDGIVYAESGLIMEHLVTKYGANTDLIWKNAEEENTIKYALYAGESNIMIAGFMLGIHRMAASRLPYGLSALLRYVLTTVDSFYAAGAFHKAMSVLQAQVDRNGDFYCNGRFTVADIMYHGTVVQLINLTVFDDLDRQYPGVAKWMKHLEALPSFASAKQKEKELDERAFAGASRL